MNNCLFKKFKYITMLTIVSFSLFSPLALANQQPPPQTTVQKSQIPTFNLTQYLNVKGQKNISNISKKGNTKNNPIANFIIRLINLVILIAGSASFLGVIIGGFFILSSTGIENRLNKGKEIITYAITGLVITLSAYFIVAFVQGIIFAG